MQMRLKSTWMSLPDSRNVDLLADFVAEHRSWCLVISMFSVEISFFTENTILQCAAYLPPSFANIPFTTWIFSTSTTCNSNPSIANLAATSAKMVIHQLTHRIHVFTCLYIGMEGLRQTRHKYLGTSKTVASGADVAQRTAALLMHSEARRRKR